MDTPRAPTPGAPRPADLGGARHYDLDAYNAVIRARAADLDERVPADAIEGAVPAALRGGSYLLNGPGLVELGGRLMHPFDGHGYVRALRFDERGGARLRGRFVDTMAYRVEASEGTIRYRGLGTLVADPTLRRGGWLDNLRAPMDKDVANTAIVPWNGRLLALWEGGLPHALDPDTLETLGRESFGSTVDPPYLAHTRVDHPRGRLVGLSPRPGPRATALTFFEHDAAGKLVCRRDASIPEFTIIHDFAITERFYVVFAAAMRPDPRAYLRAKIGLGTLIDAVGLDRARASTVYLVPREGGGPPIPITLGRPLFAIHHASAHDLVGPDGRPIAVVFDSCCLEDFEFGREFGYRGADRRLDPGVVRGAKGQRLTRFRLDIQGRRAKGAALSPYCVDFPRVHPTRDGYGCRYVYGATTDVPGVAFPFNALVRIDCARAESEADLAAASTLWAPGRGRLCGEPVFVPDPESDDEAAGWVLAMIYDGAAATSLLCVLDAQRLDAGPVASVDLELLLPYGFHGNWSPPRT
ncbi:MAG: carotenoid oxygenase family protein [Nannocystaceae bacterium]